MNKYEYECSITYAFNNSEDYTKSSRIIAESPSKARYKFYQELDAEDNYSEYFRYIKVKKIGFYDENEPYISEIDSWKLEQFEKVILNRNIPFAKIGMKISVNNKIGKIIGANSAMNLDVDFNNNGSRSNCHPHWITIYYDEENNIIKQFN